MDGKTLGVSGQAYIGGLHAVVADPFGAALGIVLVGLFVIRIVRRMRLYTVYEIVEHRFGSAAALLWSIYGAAVNIGWIGATMVALMLGYWSLSQGVRRVAVTTRDCHLPLRKVDWMICGIPSSRVPPPLNE